MAKTPLQSGPVVAQPQPTMTEEEAKLLQELEAVQAAEVAAATVPEVVATPTPEVTPQIINYESGYVVVHPLIVKGMVIDTLQPLPANHGLDDENMRRLLLAGAIKKMVK